MIHAIGAFVCLALAVGSHASAEFRAGLAMSGGSREMVERFGAATPLFLAGIGGVLAVLAMASWRRLPWAWQMTLVVYGVGVLGSLWQVGLGIPQGWLSAVVNAAVVAYAATPAVRRAYASGSRRSGGGSPSA